ncbi:MAG: hypothetical protein P1R58_07930, partial [bacterium]|nr:hypothetical protein [bacterium]
MQPDLSRSQILVVLALALLVTAASICTHFTADATLMVQKEKYWQTAFTSHKTAAAFKVRPVTTKLMGILHDRLRLSYKSSFYLIQFSLMFLAGPIFFWFLSSLRYSYRQSVIGMLLFTTSYPFFMAFFEPVYTWSDFWVYTMIPLCFALTLRNKIWLAALAFGLAQLARETTLLFLPIWILLMKKES